MRSTTRAVQLGVAVAVFTLSLASVLARSAAEGQKEPAMSAEEQAMMANWNAYMTPGEEHKLLAQRAGSWSAKVTMWMAPGAPPQVSEGTSEMRMIMGGRYLEDVTTSTFNGMPFEGRGISGYDTLKKKFVFAWIDNMGTGIMVGKGTYNPKTRSFASVSEGPDLMTGKVKTLRGLDTIIDADNWKAEMFDKGPDGKEFKSMEIVYKRKK
jgi:hypothetical protein